MSSLHGNLDWYYHVKPRLEGNKTAFSNHLTDCNLTASVARSIPYQNKNENNRLYTVRIGFQLVSRLLT